MQVGVWIPKAKAGPMADHFRPLGMPNTIDRLVDGSTWTTGLPEIFGFTISFWQPIFSVFEKDIHMAIMLGFFILEIQKFTSATIMQQRLLNACFHIYMHVYAFFKLFEIIPSTKTFFVPI